MAIKNNGDAIFDTLSYDATQISSRNNILIYKGNSGSKKRLDGLQASWVPTTNATAPTNLHTGRLIVVEGEVSPQDFIDPQQPLNTDVIQGRVRLDIETASGDHKIISLGQLGLVFEEGVSVSIIQTCMYRSGDTDGQPGATLATLVAQLNDFYESGPDATKWKLR